MGQLAFHIRALIAKAEPGNLSPRIFLQFAPEGAQSRAVESGGRGRLLPKKSNTPKVPFSKLKV